tara:strand:+ start:1478 stop:1870 length:393 start_codon:yes stop_codon:yes gene_type:complete
MTDCDIGNIKKVEIKELVTIKNFHLKVPDYIHSNKIIIENCDDMVEVVLNMIRQRYFFNIDKNTLRDFMDDLVLIYNPDLDECKNRVMNLICDSDSESDSCSDEEGGVQIREMSERESRRHEKKKTKECH